MKITKHNRNYIIPNKDSSLIPSVTEIVQGAKTYIKPTPAMQHGSKVHDRIEVWINKYGVRLDAELKNIINEPVEGWSDQLLIICQLQDIIKKFDIKDIKKPLTEYSFYHEELNYKGTIDCLLDTANERYQFDWKTGVTKGDPRQQGGYAQYSKPTKAFLVYTDGWEEVDIQANITAFNEKLEAYSPDGNMYTEENDLLELEVINYHSVNNQIVELTEQKDKHKEAITAILDGKKLKRHGLSVYYKKGSVSKTFSSEFKKEHKDALIESVGKSSVIFEVVK